MGSRDRSVDFTLICRACLCGPETGVEIMFSLSDSDVLDRFVGCTAIPISSEDDLPLQICLACMEKCENWHSFRELCVESDLKLRSAIKKNIHVIQEYLPVEQEEIIEEEEEEIIESIDTPFTYAPEEEYLAEEPEPIVEDKIEVTITEDSLVCPVCGIESLTEESYERHIKDHYSRVSEHKCLVCTKELKCKYSVIKHTHEHSGRRIPCMHCPKFFPGQGHLKSHINKYHRNKRANGEYLVQVIGEYESHSESLSCPICQESFNDRSSYDCHVKGHYAGRTEFNCLVCDKQFQQMSSAVKHTDTHGQGSIPCSFCTRFFRGSAHLRSHIGKYHRDRKQAMEATVDIGAEGRKVDGEECCYVCGKFSKNLKEHLQTHAKDRSFECKSCGASFNKKWTLIRHEWTHKANKDVQCGQCDKTFWHENGLKDHIAKRHNASAEPLKCQECGKEFSYRSGLLEHMNTHTGTRQYPCDVCGKVFRRSQVLRSHQLIHKGEKAHTCPHCPYAFFTGTKLKIHMRTHSRREGQRKGSLKSSC